MEDRVVPIGAMVRGGVVHKRVIARVSRMWERHDGSGTSDDRPIADIGRWWDASPVILIVHIPKTAGTTLFSTLSNNYPTRAIRRFDPASPSSFREFEAKIGPRAPSVVIGHYTFGLHRWLPRPACYATMLREPVARVVSHFNHVASCKEDLHRSIFRDYPTLDRFVDFEWGADHQTRYLTGWPEDRVAADPEEAARRAIEIMERHFAIGGVTERFDESMTLFKRVFGWRLPFYERQNRAEDADKVHLGHKLPRDLVERVREKNRADMRLYAYANARLDATFDADPSLRAQANAYRARLVVRRALGHRQDLSNWASLGRRGADRIAFDDPEVEAERLDEPIEALGCH